MPIPTDADLEAFIATHGPYRLGCRGGCFRDDFDGVKELPTDWVGISEERSLREALSTYEDEGDPDPPEGYRLCDWETHLGWCPNCKDEAD